MANELSRASAIDWPHNIILEDRARLSVSGVEDVVNFDESIITAYTSRGLLIIKGENLHIGKLNLENGELSVEGTVYSLEYEEEVREKGSFFSRLFR